jgi:hypothetical protein
MKIIAAIATSAAALLSGCASTVTNYGLNDHFSSTEYLSGTTSTPEQCANTMDAVWVEGTDFHECIRYFPSDAFASGHVERAVVFLEGDQTGGHKIAANYSKHTPASKIEQANLEQRRDGGLAYVLVARPGMDGSSGQTSLKRTHYETEVMQAAIEKIKAKYGIKELGLLGLSGGGGVVADLIAERQDVLCAVSASGVTSAVLRAREKGLSADVETHTPFSQMWDPIDQLPRVHPMPGFRMFVASDRTDGAVSFTSQQNYVQHALKDGLPISQIEVHGSGEEHHDTDRVGNRVMQACMAGAPTDYIVKTFGGLDNSTTDMDALARKIIGRG